MAVLYRFICKIGWINPSKVVIMEGGICSQILWYYEGVRCCPSIEAEFDMSFYEDGWQHILNMRYHGKTGAPHPQMKELMGLIYDKLVQESDGRIQ